MRLVLGSSACPNRPIETPNLELAKLLKSLENKSERVLRFRIITWPPFTAKLTVSPASAAPSKAQYPLAEFERAIIRERTRAGLDAVAARGRKGGRSPKHKADDLKAAKALLADSTISVDEIARRLGVSPATLYRHLLAARSSTTSG